MQPVFIGVMLVCGAVVACTVSLKRICSIWGVKLRLGWTGLRSKINMATLKKCTDGDVALSAVILDAHNIAIPVHRLTSNWLVPSADCCVIKHIICSVDVGPMLKLRAPAICVSVMGVTVRMEVSSTPSRRRIVSPELLRYLNAVEAILFSRNRICRLYGMLHHLMATTALRSALFVMAQCIAVDMHDLAIQICTGLTCDSSVTSSLVHLPTPGCVDIHVAGFKVHPAKPSRRSGMVSFYRAEVFVAVMGVDVACFPLLSGPPQKVIKRWGFEAELKLGNQASSMITAADIQIDAKVAAKAMILQCTAADVLALRKVLQAYMRCQALHVHAGHRPCNTVQMDPAAWWRYATRCVLHHICTYPDEPRWPVHQLGKLPGLLSAYEMQRKRPGESTGRDVIMAIQTMAIQIHVILPCRESITVGGRPRDDSATELHATCAGVVCIKQKYHWVQLGKA